MTDKAVCKAECQYSVKLWDSTQNVSVLLPIPTSPQASHAGRARCTRVGALAYECSGQSRRMCGSVKVRDPERRQPAGVGRRRRSCLRDFVRSLTPKRSHRLRGITLSDSSPSFEDLL